MRRATLYSPGRRFIACISIRALLAEGDFSGLWISRWSSPFQSAPSLRRATACGSYSASSAAHFNPRPPCGGRRKFMEKFLTAFGISTLALLAEGDIISYHGRQNQYISIRALLAEGDLRRCLRDSIQSDFNPRPPCGGRPGHHALWQMPLMHFNPRPPCGGRPCRSRSKTSGTTFQSAPSLRRATLSTPDAIA